MAEHLLLGLSAVVLIHQRLRYLGDLKDPAQRSLLH